MKKTISVLLILLISLSCLSACNFNQKMSGALAGKAEATQKVEQMMFALAENNLTSAAKLMHPQSAEKAGAGLVQMSGFLSGRKTTSIELKNINVNTSTGTSGKVRQEQVDYAATLEDGTVVYLSAYYRSDKKGVGFLSFQLVLGIV
ncbi:MAG: hypothetical protein IJN42_04945 [Clostridia bacterium]|nr:hypothetical protein [Clostridia bacterium]